MQKDLSTLIYELDDVQEKCRELIKEEIMETNSTFDKLQLRDMSKIIKSDIKCRVNLEMLSGVIPRVEFSDESYRVFLDDSRAIFKYLEGHTMPEEIAGAYAIVVKALATDARHSLQDVFTIISILITAVALCLTGMPHGQLGDVIQKLDTLLEIKERQLSLVTQMTKWRSDYLN